MALTVQRRSRGSHVLIERIKCKWFPTLKVASERNTREQLKIAFAEAKLFSAPYATVQVAEWRNRNVIFPIPRSEPHNDADLGPGRTAIVCLTRSMPQNHSVVTSPGPSRFSFRDRWHLSRYGSVRRPASPGRIGGFRSSVSARRRWSGTAPCRSACARSGRSASSSPP